MSQAARIKAEPESQDVAMDDASIPPPAADQPQGKLEQLFDDEDSDDEFPSSAPTATPQENPSQPAPMYARPRRDDCAGTR